MSLSDLITCYSGTHGSPDTGSDRYRTLNGLFCCFACCREYYNIKASPSGPHHRSLFWRVPGRHEVLGRVAGIFVISFISVYDHWMVFVVSLVVGGKMRGYSSIWAAGKRSVAGWRRYNPRGYARSSDRGDLSRQRCGIRGCETMYRHLV